MTVDPSLFVFGPDRTPEALAEEARGRLAGLVHHSHLAPRDPAPGQEVTLLLEAGAGAAIDDVRVWYTGDGSSPTCSSMRVRARHVETVWDDLAHAYVDRWEATLPGQPDGSRVRYVAAGHSQRNGQLVFADSPAGTPVIFGFNVDQARNPAWIRDAVIYQIFVDRFWEPSGRFGRPLARGDEIYGGTLDGITARLDYLEDLGINAVWLTPIFPAETYHGYDALDFSTVAERLGGEAALHRLVRAAHGHGIKILLDFAPNHCSWHHPYFLAAQRDPASPYRDWFTFQRWPDQYLTFSDARSLPKLNTRNPEVIGHLCSAAVRYLTEVGVDGFRLDHALGPPLLFWTHFRERTRAAKGDSYTMGEVTQEPNDLQWYEGRMDGCLDFPLLAAFRQFFIHGSLDAAAFHSYITHNERFYGKDFTRPTFLDNHDVNRFLWAAGNDLRLLRLAAVCQFTLPQPPIVYYGTELGMSQRCDVAEGGFEAARLPMAWEKGRADVRNFYRRLIHLRRAHPAMRASARRLLAAAGRWYAFLISADGERIVVAINGSDRKQVIDLPGERGVELLRDTRVDGSVEVAPMEAALILLCS